MADMEFDAYGGNTAIKAEATGFFHIQQLDGRYFLITPEGHGYRALGINHFHMMTNRDFDGAIRKIRSWGFNAGCYQGPRWMWNRYPLTKGINLVPINQWLPDDRYAYKDVFEVSFLAQLEEEIRGTAEALRDNPNLIGYFWTDIPNWKGDRHGEDWISFYQNLPPESAGGQVWASWKQENPGATETDFLAVIARQLYAKAYAFLRKYDQNHLLFGDRYHEIDMPDHVVREILPYIDAIAIQPTSREFNFEFFDMVYERYGKPIYIADHVSSFATEEYPVTMGQAAKDPESYMAYYHRYVTAALSRPYMIGYNKCQYQDQVVPGMLKQGLLQQNEEPYPVLDGVRAANFKALEYAYSGTEPGNMFRQSNTEP